MPEILEIEAYRCAAEPVVGRTISAVDAPDPWFVKGGAGPRAVAAAIGGGRVVDLRRTGKLLLLDVVQPGGGEVTLGMRFGMTGRIVIDDRAPIEHLRYGSDRDLPVWRRFALGFRGGGSLHISDPRRLGGVELDPDESRLGPDALTLRPRALRSALAGSAAPLKARLMDQSRVAGLGNLLVDEILWRASLDPARAASSLDGAEQRRLLRHLRVVLVELGERGGSHTGDLMAERRAGGRCPRDGEPLVRRTVGGRTTVSCPRHQY